jgi:hypothetical protein
MTSPAPSAVVAGRWPTRREHLLWSTARLALVVSVAVAAFLWARVLWRETDLGCRTPDGAALSILDVELAGAADRYRELTSGCPTGVDRALWWALAAKALVAAVAGAGAAWLSERGFRVRGWRRAGPGMAATAGFAVLMALVATLLLTLLPDDGRWSPIAATGAASLNWPAYTLLGLVVAYAALGGLGWVAHASFPIAPGPVAGLTPAAGGEGTEPFTGRRVGISLSGGGVRSASFSLGALQRLDAGGIADRADYLSAVFGGSYAAGAWTIARHAASSPTGREGAGRAARPWADGSPEIAFFRQRLNYLRDREGGLGLALATLTIGLAINIATLAWMLILVSRPLGWLVGSTLISPSGAIAAGSYPLERRVWLPVLLWLGLTLLLILVWVALVRLPNRTSPRLRRAVGAVTTASSAVSVLLGSVLVALPFVVASVPTFIEDQTVWARLVEILGTGGIVAAVVAVLRKPLGSIAPRLGGVLVVALALAVGSEIAAGGAAAGWTADRTWYLATAGAFGLFYAVADPDWWSLQPYYRARLRSAYATTRDDRDPRGVVALTGAGEPSLDTYRRRPGDGSGPGRPYHPRLIVCAAMNTSGPGVVNRVGVPAYSFTFDPVRIETHWPGAGDGESTTVSVDTGAYARVFKRWDTPKLSVMTAVGMSGAAVSSAMGRLNLGSTNALLTLANLRLGLWMPNPLQVGARPVPDPAGGAPPYPRRRIGYLFKELFGVYDPTDHHVNVTDGGHWENLGLVELLRRRCTEIYCLDGSGAGPGSLATLAEAITLAAQEVDAVVDVDFASLRLGEATRGEPEGFVLDDVAVGLITYRSAGRPVGHGLIYYGKASLARARRIAPRLLAYKEKEARFPHHSTADQLFDTEQFETYRQLGNHVAGRMLTARRAALAALRAIADPDAATGGDRRREPDWALSAAEREAVLAVEPDVARALLAVVDQPV